MRRRSNEKVVFLRPRKKSFKLPILIALSLVAIMAFYFYKVIFSNTYVVANGEICESFRTEGIIIKNEVPVLSPAKGKVQLLVKSGERVRVGTPLFIVTTDEKQKQRFQNEISELEEKIESLEGNPGSSSMSFSLIEKSIDSTTQKIKEATENGEFDKVRSLQDELTRLAEERQKLLESNEASINTLKEQLNKMKEEVSKIDIVVYASEAGIVSLYIDGLEDVLVPDRAKDISHAQLTAAVEGLTKTSLPKEVNMNQAVLKIIDNFSWYIAFKAEKGLKEGRDYYIKIDNDREIRGRLASTNDNGIGFFSINTDLDSLLDSRKIDLEVIVGTHKGCMIPKEGIFYDNGVEGVYVFERGEKCFKPVELVVEDEDNIIVNGIKQGDKILLNKRGLDELFKAKYTTNQKKN